MNLKVNMARSYCDFLLAEAVLALGSLDTVTPADPSKVVVASCGIIQTSSAHGVGSVDVQGSDLCRPLYPRFSLEPGIGLTEPVVECSEEYFDEMLSRCVSNLLKLAMPRCEGREPVECTAGENMGLETSHKCESDESSWNSFVGLLMDSLIERPVDDLETEDGVGSSPAPTTKREDLLSVLDGVRRLGSIDDLSSTGVAASATSAAEQGALPDDAAPFVCSDAATTAYDVDMPSLAILNAALQPGWTQRRFKHMFNAKAASASHADEHPGQELLDIFTYVASLGLDDTRLAALIGDALTKGNIERGKLLLWLRAFPAVAEEVLGSLSDGTMVGSSVKIKMRSEGQ